MFFSRHELNFQKFDREHPDVYAEFKRLADIAVSRGRQRIGAKMLMEVIRWNYILDTPPDDDFKINNNYTAYYARKYMRETGNLIFETRGNAIL